MKKGLQPGARAFERTPVLHNMSSPPKTTVKYAGLSGLVANPRANPRGAIPRNASSVFGTALRFCLPKALLGKSPALILKHLGVAAVGDATRQLSALVNERANALALPEGCVVIADSADACVIWDDPLSVLAVLAKSSSSVWLRSKAPALHAAVQREQVVLLVPPLFTQNLPPPSSWKTLWTPP